MQPFVKKILIQTIAFIFIGILALMVLPLLVPAKAIQEGLKAELSKHHINVDFSAAPRATLLPHPHVTLGKVSIRNMPGGFASDILSIDDVTVSLSLAQFFSMDGVQEVILTHPVLHLETLPDGTHNWQRYVVPGAMETQMQAAAAMMAGFAQPTGFPGLRIVNGEVYYGNSVTRRDSAWKAIQAVSAASAAGQQADVQFTYDAKPYRLNATWQRPGSNGAVPFNMSAALPWGGVMAKGSLSSTGIFSGDLAVNAQNMAEALGLTVASNAPKLPAVKFSARISPIGDAYSLESIALSLGASQATGTAQILVNPSISGVVNMRFGALDVTDIVSLYQAYLEQLRGKNTATSTAENLPVLPGNMALSATLAAGKIKWGMNSVQDAAVTVDVQAGAATLRDITFAGAGGMQVNGTGTLSNGPHGVVVDTQLQGQGKSAREFLEYWKIITTALPAEGYGDFHFSTRFYASDDEWRLYEARMQIGAMDIGGAMTRTFGAQPKLQAALGLKSANLDDLFISQLPRRLTTTAGTQNAYKTVDWGWLANVPYPVEVNFRADDFMFAGKPGETVTGQVVLQKGKGALSALQARWNGAAYSGDMDITHTGKRPEIKTALSTDHLVVEDILHLLGIADASADTPRFTWSKTPLDFGVLQSYEGEFALHAAQATYGELTLQDAALAATLKDSTLTLTSLTGNVWNGTVQAAAALNASNVPAGSLRLTLNGVNLKSLFSYLSGITSVDGLASVSAELTSGGLNFASWMGALAGTTAINARDVSVNGLNLSGLVNAAVTAHSVEDVRAIQGEKLFSGTAHFATATGNASIQKGVLAFLPTVPLMLESDMATTHVSGTWNLASMSADLVANLLLSGVSKSAPPTAVIGIKGAVMTLVPSLDMRGVEAFVTQNAATKMLQKSP